MGLISTTALAAHQIALQVTAILFMVPLGIGMAATVRVGHAVGRDDAAGVKRAGQVAMGLGIAIAVVLTAAVIALRFAIAGSSSAKASPTPTPPSRSRHALLVIGGTFFITDGLQTIAAGALRGMNDTRMPLAVRRGQLLGHRLLLGLRARLPHDTRRARRLGRALVRHLCLCHAPGLAFPAAGEKTDRLK